MKCKDAHEMLNSYFDNKIDPLKDRILSEHIKSCDKCSAELEFLYKYRNILKNVKPVNPPDNFLYELHRRIKLEKSDNPLTKLSAVLRNFSDSFHFPLEAAGVLAVAVVLFFLYKPFFSEKTQKTADEYGVESPRSAVSSKQEKIDKTEKSDQIIGLKDLPSERNKAAAEKLSEKENIADMRSADDTLSKDREIEYDSASSSDVKKAPSAESEKKVLKSEEQPYLSESINSKGALMKRKESADTPFSDIENLFIEFDVYVISKDLADSSKLFYKIRVHSAKHSSLIKKLKENYTVIEKNPNRTKPEYEIELFLKKNKK